MNDKPDESNYGGHGRGKRDLERQIHMARMIHLTHVQAFTTLIDIIHTQKHLLAKASAGSMGKESLQILRHECYLTKCCLHEFALQN